MNKVKNELSPERKEIKAIGISLLFLVFGFLVIWLIKAVANIEGDAIFVALLLIPVIVYMVISGKLKELKGPGGLEAKFTEAASESIKAPSETVEPSIDDMQIIQKGGVRLLQEQLQEVNEAKPIVMTMELGRRGYYLPEAVLEYIQNLSQFRNFKFVVFLDEEKRFLAYMQSWAFRGLLSMPELGYEFVNVINEGRLENLFRYPGVVRETISTDSTNAEALSEMLKQNLEALVVIDENRNLKGVVEREQVLSRMMLTLTK